MKNIFRFLFLVALISSVTSCKDFLSPEPMDDPTTEIFYTTEAEVTAALTSIYKPLRESFFGSTYTLDFNGFSDEDTHYNWSEDRVRDYSVTATNSSLSTFWNNIYYALKDVAYLLEGIEENKAALQDDNNTYTKARGEALFFRGYYHFMLAQWFCSVNNGVPMYTKTIDSYKDASMPLTKLEDLFEQIIEDMIEAQELLAEVNQTWTSLGYSERVTVTAVQGMLARVCLFAAGDPNNGGSKGKPYYYNLAKEYAEKVITSGSHDLATKDSYGQGAYAQVFIDQTQDAYNTENIWEVGYQYTGTSGSDTNTGGAVGQQFGLERDCDDEITGDALNDSLLANGYRYLHPRLLTSYGYGDSRRDWNYANFIYEDQTLKKLAKTITSSTYVSTGFSAGGMGGSVSFDSGSDYGVVNNGPLYELSSTTMWVSNVGKWRREYESRITRDGNNTTTNFPLLRFSDVLLMAAEAHIELADASNGTHAYTYALSSAVTYIDRVRARAVGDTQTMGLVAEIIVDDDSNYNRGFIDLTVEDNLEIDHKNGDGFVPFIGSSVRVDSNYGRLCIGVDERGSGYTFGDAPTLKLVGGPYNNGRQITWQANTSYTAGTVVSSLIDEAAGTYRLYRATTSGTSTDVNPMRSSGTYTVSESGEDYGLSWIHLSGYYTLSNPAPKLAVYVTDGVAPTLSGMKVETGDVSSMREALRDERRRELCFEALRRQDLKRWGILYSRVVEASNDSSGNSVYGIPPYTSGPVTTLGNAANAINLNRARYLPIPQDQLTLNRNLIQNDGY